MIALMFVWAAAIVLIFALIFRPKRRVSPVIPEIHPPDTQITRKAVHEAGHAIAAWSCTLVRDVTMASIREKYGGRVEFTFRNIQTREADWCHLVISLAGIAAEGMVFSRTHALPAESDLLTALEAARRIGGGEPPWEVPDGATLPIANMYKSRPSERDAATLRTGYLMASHILRCHSVVFYKVVSMLLTREKASQRDLEYVLGNRLFAHILIGFKPRFILPLERLIS